MGYINKDIVKDTVKIQNLFFMSLMTSCKVQTMVVMVFLIGPEFSRIQELPTNKLTGLLN
jgi:hypothetical protein